MLRLSPSIIDGYRYWRYTDFSDPFKEKLAKDDLVSQIRGDVRMPSEAMMLGRTFHEALELGMPDPEASVVLVTAKTAVGEGRYRFDAATIRAVLEAQHPGMIREGRGELQCKDAWLSCRVDGVIGNEICEFKSTLKPLDTDKYLDAMQWRIYLDAFQATSVVYHLCRLEANDDGVYVLREYMDYRQYRYPGMRDDVEEAVTECADWIRAEWLAKHREKRR